MVSRRGFLKMTGAAAAAVLVSRGMGMPSGGSVLAASPSGVGMVWVKGGTNIVDATAQCLPTPAPEGGWGRWAWHFLRREGSLPMDGELVTGIGQLKAGDRVAGFRYAVDEEFPMTPAPSFSLERGVRKIAWVAVDPADEPLGEIWSCTINVV